MAHIEDAKNQNTEIDQKMIIRKQELRENYGDTLGEAIYDYMHGYSKTEEEKIERRERFAETIVSALEGSHEEKIKGVSALLDSVEAMIDPIAKQASKTASLFEPM